MKHIVFYSGGIGSWMTANRVIEQYGRENVVLLFTDTLIEDKDLYRFLDETEKDFGIKIIRVSDGRTPWQVFKDTRFLGNAKLAKCSHVLKQDTAKKWLESNFKPDECILYLGIDFTEMHRTKSPGRNWAPYKVKFPMTEKPYMYKGDMLAELKKRGIKVPWLYRLGFSHNNCSGMFKWMEEYEKEMQEFLDQEVTILKKTENDVIYPLSLEKLRKTYEEGKKNQLDLFDLGGCGCMIDS